MSNAHDRTKMPWDEGLDGDPWRSRRLPPLMLRRVEDILLVSSPYDSFILAEDGLLTELIFSEYSDLGLTHAPNVARVPTGAAALEAMRNHRFDLVITLSRLGDMDVGTFREAVAKFSPNLPVVLLVASEWELHRISEGNPHLDFSDAYVWHGDSKLFVAIIKALEDRWNAAHDTAAAGVGCIIIVEDSVQFRSSLLPIVYSELVRQSRAVLSDGINRMHKLLRLRARPKILVAADYETGIEYYEKYRQYLIGIIADVRFPRNGHPDPHAGIEFIKRVKSEMPDLPALLQSSEEENRPLAEAHGANFLHKVSPALLQNVRNFMLNNFGFGDFVFRRPDGREVGRASNLRSLVQVLERIPIESVEYHARHNHFSAWLRARTEFDLAAHIRPMQISSFDDLESMRREIIEMCDDAVRRNRRGLVEDFSRYRFDTGSEFARIGSGSLGGKARGLAFVDALIARHDLDHDFENVRLFVPRMLVIATDIFDIFVRNNYLMAEVVNRPDNETLRAAFLRATLPKHVLKDLAAFLTLTSEPIAVRSSSLLEDSQYHPFAGIYDTFMVPNNERDDAVRLQHLTDAIKLVYASTFSNEARRYIDSTPYRIEEQKMAVILQPVIGRQRDQLYYPSFAGTARSHNYYPFGRSKPEDGVASVGLGLGKYVVDGGPSVRFSPKAPKIVPNISEPERFVDESQRFFYAINLEHSATNAASEGRDVQRFELEVAEQQGTLGPVGSVWSPQDDAIYDGLHRAGVRVVSFAHVRKSQSLPIGPILERVLQIGTVGMNSPIDVEFACNLDTNPREFAILQIRPCQSISDTRTIDLDNLPQDQLLCTSPQALGHGLVSNISDVVVVRPEAFDPTVTEKIAQQVGKLNEILSAEHRPYLLIGPGRWGSSTPSLGIPVTWLQISSARVIIEASLDNFSVDPSQGSHFFHNLIALGVGYLTINPRAGLGSIDWDWLQQQHAVGETEFLRHLRLPAPLEIRLDGSTTRAAILKQRLNPFAD